MASTGSTWPRSRWCGVAPNSRRHLQLPGVDVDGDDRVGTCEPCEPGDGGVCPPRRSRTRRPSRPDPRCTRVHGGAEAGHHAAADQARRPRASPQGPPWWPDRHATRVFSAKAPIPRAGDSAWPSRVIFRVALWVAKQYQGRPRLHERQSPADGTPVQDHEVARHHVGDTFARPPRPGPSRLMAEQERKVVVDGTLPVVEVRVAYPTCLDGHEDLTRARVRDLDGLDGDRLTLGSGDYGPDAVRHDSPLGSTGRPEVDPTTAGR